MARRDMDSATLFEQDRMEAEAARAQPKPKPVLQRATMLADQEFSDPGHKHGKSIKKPKVYEALKRKGYSKSKAARISNAMRYK